MSLQFINLSNEFFFFNDSFFNEYNYFLYTDYLGFFFLNDYRLFTFLEISKNSNDYANSIISFINQTEDLSLINNVENISTIYHYSIPNTKLAYPEPFIASPSFMHSDLWFIHILVYQYWLWFVFVFIIVFFFITFVCTIRWCNMRIRPRRETRGVSRSKCGDLITACVPVTWATSIIVNESTDAIDYYDGFGTTELVVGIRAYQWGWEYYYPKDIDLNYNIKQNYSTFIGNSLKYEKSSNLNLKVNNLWKFYQNKMYDQVITPAHLLTIPFDNYKILNFLNFQDIGSSPVSEVNAFKKVRMFSKVYTSNLIFNVDSYSSKYKIISSLYNNDNLYTESYLYGLKRQHNFLSNKAFFNNQNTFFNPNSIKKLINFNFNSFTYSSVQNSNTAGLSFFKKLNYTNFFLNSPRTIGLFDKFFFNTNRTTYANSIFFNKTHFFFNDNSDKNSPNYPFLKLFNLKLKKKIFNNNLNLSLNNLNSQNDISLINNNDQILKFFNFDKSYKTSTIFSPNQTVLLSNRYIRNFLQTPSNRANFNYTIFLNPINSYISNSKNSSGSIYSYINDLSNTNWVDLYSSSKLISAKPVLDYPHSPISSNHLSISTIDYDNLNNSFNDEIPTALQGKEELMPTFLPNIYWNFYWANSSNEWRFYNSQNYNLTHSLFYSPFFNFYYDYDFRNWQSFELLEDAFWESSYSVYTHDEFVNTAFEFYEYTFFDKLSDIFNNFDRHYKYKNKTLVNSCFSDLKSTGFFYANSIYLDDYLPQSSLVNTKDFFIFPLFTLNLTIEDNYDSVKYLNYFYNLNNNLLLNFNNLSLQQHSFFTIFDSFRSDYEEFSWFYDDQFDDKLGCFFKNMKNFNLNEFLNNYIDFSSIIFNNYRTIILDKTIRSSNQVNLRAPSKSSIVTYNAIQKVFRTRFDENRSNTKLSDFGYFYNKQPFISSPRVNYEKLLGKTKNNFFSVNLYKNNFATFINPNYSLSTGLNFYFYDFPFLLALKSDASRYLWFDWYSKWGFYEVQPSSSSRFAIYGMPYLSKNFEFSTVSSENLNESETYLLRISRARRNYLPNWTYSPYFYAKHNTWYKNNIFFEIFNLYNSSLIGTYFILTSMNWYWTAMCLFNYSNNQFYPSHSGSVSYSKLGWKPQNSIQSYYYSVSSLIDVLTKREYLYRELFLVNNKILNLPFYLTNTPNNPLISEIKSSFLFIDPTVLTNEYSREVHNQSLNFFNFLILKNFLINLSSFSNTSLLTNYIFYYFFNDGFLDIINKPNELYKSQYRPLKKGISNMIRLHATGAIAMPIEIRLQVLASSKDVIHSWAIPSAGIKIDCVPGYSSHKVMIFLVSGIFWGQCMEICGRYHHWMPIVIYFMKRDLFFLWCTHFVFLSGSNNMWNINDRQYTDYLRLASFDKSSWISETSI